MKKIKLDGNEDGIPSTALREISLLQELEHPYVVSLKDVVCEESKLHLVFNYVKSDLKKYIEKNGKPLAMDTIKPMMYQMLVGLNYLHTNRVIHRDLKPNNVLVDEKGNC